MGTKTLGARLEYVKHEKKIGVGKELRFVTLAAGTVSIAR